MKYYTNDSWGHVTSERERRELRQAIDLLNSNSTIAALEEDGNHHSAADYRREMADDLHVADIDGWDTKDGCAEAVCTICGGVL